MVQTGLIFDLILGAVLQDWHFNFARQIHDGLTKRSGNGLLGLMVIILVESVIVVALLLAAVLTIPANPDYAPAATIIGSLLFGLGMWLARGCIVDNFVQVGNGDLHGLLTLLAPLLIGLLAGGAFLANAWAQSFGGFAIADPLLSWYGFIKGHGAGITIGVFLVALVKR